MLNDGVQSGLLRQFKDRNAKNSTWMMTRTIMHNPHTFRSSLHPFRAVHTTLPSKAPWQSSSNRAYHVACAMCAILVPLRRLHRRIPLPSAH